MPMPVLRLLEVSDFILGIWHHSLGLEAPTVWADQIPSTESVRGLHATGSCKPQSPGKQGAL